jgi:mRNA-degrading endonuclease RelE of RelBE toxin-antitoxin system
MAYSIELTDLVVGELKAIRAFERRRIVDEINGQLAHQPTLVTRNRNRLDAVSPDFKHVPPIWELRVGDYRVFYDVDGASRIVFVRAVRLKGQGRTTEEIVDERNNP